LRYGIARQRGMWSRCFIAGFCPRFSSPGFQEQLARCAQLSQFEGPWVRGRASEQTASLSRLGNNCSAALTGDSSALHPLHPLHPVYPPNVLPTRVVGGLPCLRLNGRKIKCHFIALSSSAENKKWTLNLRSNRGFEQVGQRRNLAHLSLHIGVGWVLLVVVHGTVNRVRR
jgi:hypothetical protein